MLKKFKNHILLAVVFFCLSLIQQYAFYAVKGFPIVWLTPGKYLGVLAFFFFFTFSTGQITRFLLLSFLMILNLFQMGHLSYFGTQILPNEIFLFFAEFNEVSGVLNSELQHVLIPLLFTIIPLGLGYLAYRKLKTTYSFKFVPVVFALYFIFNPIRTYVTGNTWGRQPSTRELSGMNVYLSISYFLGKILPHKLEANRYSLQKNESLKLEVKEGPASTWDNIIVVLGESLTPNHMNLFGYSLQTTEYLNSLKDQKNFYYLRGLSTGVSTDISVAFFLNLGYGVAGNIRAAKGEHCLFKLAKKQGRSTHFLSTQSSEQLRYIAPYLCSAFLDDYRSLEDISPDTQNANAAIDRHLLPKLELLLNTPGKKFIMLHQRGSHGPWKLRSTPESQKFTNVDSRISDYDNSVVEFDLFWKELNQLLAAKTQKTLVVYLSDHGESVGEGNRWGHGFLRPTAFEIPMLFQSFNQDLPAKTKDLPKNLPQYNLGLYLIHTLGLETNQSPFTFMKDYEIYGNDIDGFAGKAQVSFGPGDTYQYKAIP